MPLPKRFGVVGFGGIGEVVPGGGEAFRINYLLPAGGGTVGRTGATPPARLGLRVSMYTLVYTRFAEPAV